MAAKELDLVLTGRDCGLEERAPMCGVPHHAVDTYVSQLVSKGYKVAICEQLEDPKTATKGIVKRGITRIVTAGTVVEPGMLQDNENNYLLALAPDRHAFGISWCDVSTGEFRYRDKIRDVDLGSEFLRLQPREILMPEDLVHNLSQEIQNALAYIPGVVITSVADWQFRADNAEKMLFDHFRVAAFSSFDASSMNAGLCAAGALLGYLHDSQKNELAHITKLKPVQSNAFMVLDSACVRNLELVQNLASGKKKGSLLWFLDRTRTASGGRLLKKTVLSPLLRKDQIERRLDLVEALFEDPVSLLDLRNTLDEVRDLERILSRLSYGTITAKDALSLKQTLQTIPRLKEIIRRFSTDAFAQIDTQLADMQDLVGLLEKSICEDPASSLTDGHILKKGFDSELDTLIDFSEKEPTSSLN